MTALKILFEKPNRSKYYRRSKEEPNYICPPKLRGQGCYGDCYDCFEIDESRFKTALGMVGNGVVSEV